MTCESRYEGVVRSLLGRTAVAEDLDYAVTMARKYGYRFRVVTLDGQVVNAGGSLTGGSHVKNAGLLSRRAQIESLQQEAQAPAGEGGGRGGEAARRPAGGCGGGGGAVRHQGRAGHGAGGRHPV